MDLPHLAGDGERAHGKKRPWIDLLDYWMRCSSSLVVALVVLLMPETTPALYRACVLLLALSSIVHHTIEESIPAETWASSKAYNMAFRADGAAISGTCVAFLVCLRPELGVSTQMLLCLAAALVGFCSRPFKLFVYLAGCVGVAATQPDVRGVVTITVNQVLSVIVVALSIHAGRWYGSLHLWVWHILAGVFLWFGAQALTASERGLLF